MSATAGRTTTGKVWHVAVWAGRADRFFGGSVALCGSAQLSGRRLTDLRDLATVPALGLCQKCERAVEQIAVAVREVQS